MANFEINDLPPIVPAPDTNLMGQTAGGATGKFPFSAISNNRVLVRKTAGQSIPAASITTLTWQAVEHDPLGAFSSPSTIIVPAGFSFARFTAYADWDDDDGGSYLLLRVSDVLTPNNVYFGATDSKNPTGTADTDITQSLISVWAPVTPGQEFICRAEHNNTSQNVNTNSLFQVEFI
jgi:hypothetical protein